MKERILKIFLPASNTQFMNLGEFSLSDKQRGPAWGSDTLGVEFWQSHLLVLWSCTISSHSSNSKCPCICNSFGIFFIFWEPCRVITFPWKPALSGNISLEDFSKKADFPFSYPNCLRCCPCSLPPNSVIFRPLGLFFFWGKKKVKLKQCSLFEAHVHSLE